MVCTLMGRCRNSPGWGHRMEATVGTANTPDRKRCGVVLTVILVQSYRSQREADQCVAECGMALEFVVDSLSVAKTECVCPKHLEIIRPEPGACPICWTALESHEGAVEKQENPELDSIRRRLWAGAALTVSVLAATMSEIFLGAHFKGLVTPRTLTWTELALASPVVLWGGWPLFVRGWQSIVNR